MADESYFYKGSGELGTVWFNSGKRKKEVSKLIYFKTL